MGRTRRGLALLAAIAVAMLSAWAALVGMVWGFGLKCDDGCSSIGDHWTDDPDSWQWTAWGWSGIGVFVLSLIALVLVLARRRNAAWMAYAAWLVFAAVFATLIFSA
jgi:hypothetical protein